MSSSNAGSSRSRRIEHPACGEDLVPAEWIANQAFLDQVHLPAENRAKFVFHLDSHIERHLAVPPETDQDVDVAVGTEVVAKHRAEESEFLYAPLSAELFDPLSRNGEIWNHSSPLVGPFYFLAPAGAIPSPPRRRANATRAGYNGLDASSPIHRRLGPVAPLVPGGCGALDSGWLRH